MSTRCSVISSIHYNMMLMLVWRCAHDNSICAYVMDVLVLHVVAHGVPTICQHMESPTMLSEPCITALVAFIVVHA